MERRMTILEAIKMILEDAPEGMTYRQIYQKIVNHKLYEFGAKTPQNVVHGMIRRHCMGIEFPTASPVKFFRIDHVVKRENYYALYLEGDDIKENINKKDRTRDEFDTEDELLPEERMVQVYQHYLGDLKRSLMEVIMGCHPSFFEKMVVDLLLAMGYGYDDKSGQVVGKPHDGGIDGIISEDKLGLDVIYIQAKRYSEGNNVGILEVRAFVGAMDDKTEKGVFITTSHYTKEAIEFANSKTSKHIRLIDGETLVDLMIKYEIGLERVKEYIVYKVNEDYFSDNI